MNQAVCYPFNFLGKSVMYRMYLNAVMTESIEYCHDSRYTVYICLN